MFEAIELNLTDKCNRECSFCPQSLMEFQQVEKGFMDLSVIDTIVSICRRTEMNPVFLICGFGEPLLHKRLSEVLDLLADYRIVVFSNMDVVLSNREKIRILDRPNVRIMMNLYDCQDLDQFRDIQSGLEYARSRIVVHEEKPPVRYQNRADIFQELGKEENKFLPCHLPKNHLVIDYDGSIRLCCNDWFRQNQFGSVFAFDTFLESSDYLEIAELVSQDRQQFDFCKNCNMPSTQTFRGSSLYEAINNDEH